MVILPKRKLFILPVVFICTGDVETKNDQQTVFIFTHYSRFCLLTDTFDYSQNTKKNESNTEQKKAMLHLKYIEIHYHY